MLDTGQKVQFERLKKHVPAPWDWAATSLCSVHRQTGNPSGPEPLIEVEQSQEAERERAKPKIRTQTNSLTSQKPQTEGDNLEADHPTARGSTQLPQEARLQHLQRANHPATKRPTDQSQH